MKKLKKGFRKIFLIAIVISLLIVSCRQPSVEVEVEKISVTVQKGVHIIKAPDNLILEKGSKLGFTHLKDKMALEFEATYELAKIALSSGEEITDTAPHIFNENTIIIVSAQNKVAVQGLN